MPSEIATTCAKNIHKRLSELKGEWVHDHTSFLPANVLCDYAGEQGFVNLIAEIIAETLDNQPKG